MNQSVLSAIFRRNFSSYFANPTGYVFICVFVLLSSIAAFWPNEFFTANLANLDQLNKAFPLIMLIFIPAITMSIWAEERRQGTDELLLTIPATDFDVVLGKYLAAVAIYGVSLLFSFICNLIVLSVLGDPDLGLLGATYIGYFLVGMAMLSVGMVASFLTNNITVGFVLGALFNSVLVGLSYADAFLPTDFAFAVKEFGIAAQLRDYTQGVVGLRSTAYFLAIVVVMLYLAMVLIGKRHWAGGRDGHSLGPHYAVRALALAASAVGLLWMLQLLPARADLSEDGLSTLSPSTRKLVAKLDPARPIQIEAFISPHVPESYVPIRLDLINRLREISAYGGKNITLRIFDTEPFSEQSDRAEKTYGITGRTVDNVNRGQVSTENIFLGFAMVSGLDKVVIPFVDRSTPIEYEIVRSLTTLNGTARKRLGVFLNEKQSFQEFASDRPGRMGDPEILTELKKQYDVVDIEADKPVPDNIDVLLAIQPSILRPNQLDNLLAAVRRGVPTAIFEDPQPEYFPNLVDPNQRGGQFPFMQSTETKKLWDTLGIDVETQKIVTHGYNPLKRFQEYPPEIVFVGNGALGNQTGESLFDEKDAISAKTQELVFMFPGAIVKKANTGLTFAPLVRTSKVSGYVDKFDLMTQDPFGGRDLNPRRRRHPTGEQYVLAAHITGPAPAITDAGAKPLAADEPKADPDAKPAAAAPAAAELPKNEAAPAATTTTTTAATTPATPAPAATPSATPAAAPSGTAAKPAAPAKPRDMNVVVVTDVDMLTGIFFRLRSQRSDLGDQVPNFDNVTFVLNALDVLAGDDRFVDVRKRRPTHRSLATLDALSQASTDRMQQSNNDYQQQFEDELTKEEKQLNDKLAELRADTKLKQIDKESRLEIFERDIQRRLAAKRQQLEVRRQKQQKELMRDLADGIRIQQSRYKWCAVLLPPIPPLIIGLIVFFNRRLGEQEGVSRKRLK
jgi:ABC-2 type transport system permease protein